MRIMQKLASFLAKPQHFKQQKRDTFFNNLLKHTNSIFNEKQNKFILPNKKSKPMAMFLLPLLFFIGLLNADDSDRFETIYQNSKMDITENEIKSVLNEFSHDQIIQMLDKVTAHQKALQHEQINQMLDKVTAHKKALQQVVNYKHNQIHCEQINKQIEQIRKKMLQDQEYDQDRLNRLLRAKVRVCKVLTAW